jgi:hypothetical protein
MARRLLLCLALAACAPSSKPATCADSGSCPAPAAPTERGAGPAGPTAATVCGFFDDRVRACGLDAEHHRCPALAVDLSPMRQDYLWRLALCLEGVPCGSLTGAPGAWPACHDVAVSMMPSTKPLRDFCFAASRRAAECGLREQADQAACLAERRYLRDIALAEAHGCLLSECDAVGACLQRTLLQRTLRSGAPRSLP